MTAIPEVHDQLTEPDADRFDDNGASQDEAWPSSGCRLTWGPSAQGPHLAAAWWPRSRDAAAELPDLIDAASARMGGLVTRVSLNLDAWAEPHPRRLPLRGRVVRIGWFHHIDSHLVTVGRGTFDRLSIAVLPPEMDADAARDVLRRLQSASPWPTAPAALLESGDAPGSLDR